MVREAYESPKMEFEEVRLTRPVAETCWGYHDKGTVVYADVNGASKSGYYSFYLSGSGSGNGCDLNLTSVTYYSSKGSTGSPATTDQIQSLKNYLSSQTNANSAANFKGFSNVIFDDPDDPRIS